MPTSSEHLHQYSHNKGLLDQPLFDIDKTLYKDWVITIAFYNAVHLVEKELALISIPYHSGNHLNREKAIIKEKKLRTIAAKYQALYNQSVRARYQCCSFTKTDIADVIKLLGDIESTLL